MAFLQPRDPRWQGPQRWYFRIELLKNIVLIAFSILVIVETSLHRKWYNAFYNTVEYDSSRSTYAPAITYQAFYHELELI
jgi:hypothetical protein